MFITINNIAKHYFLIYLRVSLLSYEVRQGNSKHLFWVGVSWHPLSDIAWLVFDVDLTYMQDLWERFLQASWLVDAMTHQPMFYNFLTALDLIILVVVWLFNFNL